MIISDCFAPYVNTRANPFTSRLQVSLQHKNLAHIWVNHSQEFVHPDDNRIHINTIERLWRSLRKKIKIKNIKDEKIQLYVNNFLFDKFTNKQDKYEILINLINRNEIEGGLNIEKPF